MDGSEWVDHEDCIIGDEQGIKNLINACEKALEKGEYYGSDLGDYVGVKKLDTRWFKSPMESRQTKWANIGLGILLIILGVLIIIGLITVIKSVV